MFFIAYIILFITTSIHSEIIIINACGLNKYVKKNINIMGYEDYKLTLLDEGRDSFNEDEEDKIENEIGIELQK